MNVLKLLFIRHAQSIGNQQKRMQGNGEFDLSPAGRQQAEKLAQRLAIEAWRPSHVYSSPLQRAMQTTEILLAPFLAEPLPAVIQDLMDGDVDVPLESQPLATIPVEYAEELREHQNGIFEGLTWGEAKARYPTLCAALEQSSDWIPIPGAESLQEARERARRFVQTLLARHHNGDQIWVVSHCWILQHLIAELLGCDRSWRIQVHNTALFEFWIDRSRWQCYDQNRFNTDLWQIRRFNDCRHLF